MLTRTVPIENFLTHCIAQNGDRYVYAAEASPLDPDPERFDCSELMQWASSRCGLHLPDGAYNQWVYCRNDGGALTIEQGLYTRGALLFVGDGTGTGRGAITHVAGSLGNGTTIEARGSKWGVGTWAGKGRFQWACLIPGAIYGTKSATVPGVPSVHRPVIREGAHGDLVKYLQTTLDRKGFLGADGKRLRIDGGFGKNTTFAVKACQRWSGRHEDGVVGANTWGVIDLLARGQ